MATSNACRNWCFTLNNPTDEERAALSAFAESQCVYMVYGDEVGESGTPHLQGFLVTKKKQRLTGVKKAMMRAYLEPARGTCSQAADYCKKDGQFTEYGALPMTQQERNKANAKRFIDLAKAGDFATIEVEMPGVYAQRYKTMKEIAKDHMKRPEDLEEPCGIWIYGDSGVGKTTAARTEYGDYYAKQANKWWDGYTGQETVVIEDLDPVHKVLGHHLKLWMDKWSFNAEEKGGARWLRPKRVIVTSQYSIAEVFDDPKTVEALERRCKIIHMHKSL